MNILIPNTEEDDIVNNDEYLLKTLSVLELIYTIQLLKVSLSKENKRILLHDIIAHFKHSRIYSIIGVSGKKLI